MTRQILPHLPVTVPVTSKLVGSSTRLTLSYVRKHMLLLLLPLPPSLLVAALLAAVVALRSASIFR